MTARFKPHADGVEVLLAEPEVVLLERLPHLLASISDDGSDPAHERLNPAAHRNDPDASDEFRRLVEGQLASSRDDDRTTLVSNLRALGQRPVLAIDEAEAWLRVIGEARLVIAARRDIVEEDDDWSTRASTDPELGLLAYLGFLQEGLVDVLMQGMPPIS